MRPIFARFFALHHSENTGESYDKIHNQNGAPAGDKRFHDGSYPLRTATSSAIVHAGNSQNSEGGVGYLHDPEDGLGKAIQVQSGWDVQYLPNRNPIDG